MVRRTLGILAGVIASVGGLALASPAAAIDPGGGGWDHTWASINGGATLHVVEHGDMVALCDTKADGMSVHVDVSWGGGGYYLQNSAGNGTCVTVSATTAAKYDMPEGKTIDIWLSTSDLYDQVGGSYLNDH
ncbi:hypothetical protein [Actinacidiphila bryophytorum]|uniref:Secreted protein n=1 Tax=Actinacidiphila bryophytorum TaxID=1436133 RepID=A0A9W4ECY4_9ACTN|nr:hypothetical protein [Actinacidiphila bryophytorum]MBM9438043.1 hypothetical protein [Actinacidiphila bryophytorum]MBN6541655.1 hypothetical protein [Actinacidiphila bryophytorum]CAG7618211.1 conserved exported hypothetical protein [Actinacidiphila bryophytorum]